MNIHVMPDERPQAMSDSAVKTVNFALQGGGAHGAFTWGVLDRILEDPRIAIEGISATSAGAMNAAVLAYGLTIGGREGARQALTNFWRRVAHAASFSPLQPTMFDRLAHNHGLENSPAHLVFDILSRVLSPYQWNPLNYNPLRGVLEQAVDFDGAAQGIGGEAVPLGDQRAHRQGEGVHRAGDHGRLRARLGLPAVPLSGRRISTASITGTAATWAIRRCSR